MMCRSCNRDVRRLYSTDLSSWLVCEDCRQRLEQRAADEEAYRSIAESERRLDEYLSALEDEY